MHAVVEKCVFRELNISSGKQIFSLIWRKERVQGLKHKPAAGKEQEGKAAGFSALPCQTLGFPMFCLCSSEESIPLFLRMRQMNVSETTKSFLVVLLAGTTYVSWTVPWKAVTWARAACLPPCSRASRCRPLCLPPLPAATAERGTACAKNNDPPSRAAQALPVPQSCSAP